MRSFRPANLFDQTFSLLRLVSTPDGRGGHTRSYEVYKTGVHGSFASISLWTKLGKVIAEDVRGHRLALVQLNVSQAGPLSIAERLRYRDETAPTGFRDWEIMNIVTDGGIHVINVKDVQVDGGGV